MANALLEAVSVGRIPVSVVIPTLNEAARIEAAIESVRWADEVIVIDAGSTDGTAERAESFGARVIRIPRKLGPAAARNAGALARGTNRGLLSTRPMVANLPFGAVIAPIRVTIDQKQEHSEASG